MRGIIRLLTICLLGSVGSFAQVDPSAVGGAQGPGVRNIVYALRYSQSAQFSSQIPTMQNSNLSATFDYRSAQQRYPFTVEYGGGYIWTLSGPNYQSGQFHHLLLTQEVTARRWNLKASDDVSYLPQSPTIGFSGIPGTGEIFGQPNPTPSTGQSILTGSTHVLTNLATGEIDHTLNYATTASLNGSYALLRFPNNDGIDNDTISGTAQLGRRLSARTTLTGQAVYMQYRYTGTPVSITTGTGYLGIRHRWTRAFTTNVSAGPQEIKSSIGTLIPTSISYAINASASYQLRFSQFDANYTHGVNGGSGYLIGGTVDGVMGNFSHQFGPNTLLGIMGGYNRTSALNIAGTTNSQYGGVQASWRVARDLIVFANYSAMNQSSTAVLPGTALNDLRNIVAFGFGYSSRETRLRR